MSRAESINLRQNCISDKEGRKKGKAGGKEGKKEEQKRKGGRKGARKRQKQQEVSQEEPINLRQNVNKMRKEPRENQDATSTKKMRIRRKKVNYDE